MLNTASLHSHSSQLPIYLLSLNPLRAFLTYLRALTFFYHVYVHVSHFHSTKKLSIGSILQTGNKPSGWFKEGHGLCTGKVELMCLRQTSDNKT